jgi:glucose/arabinose dehydrogenase/cytochrome c5
MKTLILAMLLLPLSSFAGKYKTEGNCGGFPRVDVKTAPGICLGLVYEENTSTAQSPKKLRWAAEIGPGKILVTDLVGWGEQTGAIYLLNLKESTPRRLQPFFSQETLAGLPAGDLRREIIHQPNQISRGPEGKIYVGTSSAIMRFDPGHENPLNTFETVITGLPDSGLHYLKSFTFDGEGNIFLNVGSESNVCQNFTKFGSSDPVNNPANHQQKQFNQCPEGEDTLTGRAQIRKYFRKPDGSYSADFIVYARGLRNSIALVWDPASRSLLQGENSRDAISKFAPGLSNSDAPRDELNIVAQGQHYGWPYCYSDNLNSPEWFNIDCSGFAKPQILLPAHSAPLGFFVYQGKMLPPWYKGRLIGSLHGYESGGHRIVTFKKDQSGLPTSRPLSLVYDWEERGEQGKGKPVGLTEMQDGSILIVEDDPQNAVLRLFFDKTQGPGTPVYEIDNPRPIDDELSPGQEEIRKKRMNQKMFDGNVPPFTRFEDKVIDKTCYACHQTAGAPGVRLLRYDDEGNEKRIRDAGLVQVILKALKGEQGVPAMPPTGWDSLADQQEAITLLEEWLKSVK